MSVRLDDLEPITRQMARKFLDDSLTAGLLLKVTQTLRTMEEQSALYARGRSLPGPIVTHAQAGQSAHNWGCAFDVCFDGPEPYSEKHPWDTMGGIGKSVGLVWGGDFKNIVDRPHFERSDWRSVREAA